MIYSSRKSRIIAYYTQKYNYYRNDGIVVDEFKCRRQCGEKRCYCRIAGGKMKIGTGCPLYMDVMIGDWNK